MRHRNRSGRLLAPWMAVAAWTAVGIACGDDTIPDCSACGEHELCVYTVEISGAVDRTECVAFPEACTDDTTCDCVNDTEVCDDFGWVQNSNACSDIETRPTLYCEANLG